MSIPWNIKHLKLTTAACVLALLAITSSLASTVNTQGSHDLAIGGYDPVAYFEQSRPAAGNSTHIHHWQGVTWRFQSAANKALFIADPERFAPQYGGYCAWAVANNYTAKVDPEAWHIEDGKLYLNYSKSVQRRWKQDIPGNIARADSHWPTLEKSL